MRRPTEFLPRRVSRRLGPLFAMPVMQARAANPAVVLIAALSTQPGTRWLNGWRLARAAAAVRPFVQGFQLNMTRRSTRAAVAFLRAIPAFRG